MTKADFSPPTTHKRRPLTSANLSQCWPHSHYRSLTLTTSPRRPLTCLPICQAGNSTIYDRMQAHPESSNRHYSNSSLVDFQELLSKRRLHQLNFVDHSLCRLHFVDHSLVSSLLISQSITLCRSLFTDSQLMVPTEWKFLGTYSTASWKMLSQACTWPRQQQKTQDLSLYISEQPQQSDSLGKFFSFL